MRIEAVRFVLKSRQLELEGHFPGGLVDPDQADVRFAGRQFLSGRYFEQTADFVTAELEMVGHKAP